MEATLTISETYRGGTTAGSFGYLPIAASDIMPEGIDMDNIGMSFGEVPKVKEPEPTGIKQAQVIPPEAEEPEEPWVLEDRRTDIDLRREAQGLIDNALDLPPEVIEEAKRLLSTKTQELRNHLMTQVVPLILAVEPALTSVKRMIPHIFDNNTADGLEVDLPVESIGAYSYRMGIIATQLKLIDMMGLSAEVRTRLINKMIPTEEAKRG